MSGAQYIPAGYAMGLGQILDRVYRLLRANLRIFVGIASAPPAVMYGLLGIVAAAIAIPIFSRLHHAPSPKEIGQILLIFIPLVLLILVLYWLAFALYLAAGSHAAIQADFGLPVGFGEAYRFAWSRAGRYFLLLLVIYAICFFPALLIQLGIAGSVGLSFLTKTQPNPLLFLVLPFATLLQMALLVAGCVVALRFSLAFPASVVENLAAIEALKRSNALTRGARMKIFLVLLVIYAATYLAMMILVCGSAFLIAIGVLVSSGAHSDFASPLTVSLLVVACLGFLILMVLFMACSWAGFITALCVIYNDQRRITDPVAPSGAPA